MTIEKKLLNLETLGEVAKCLKAIAHPTRLRMIQMLIRDKYTVAELAESCQVPHHVASGHLRLMKDSRLMSSKRDGQRVYYKIEDASLAKIMACVEAHFPDSFEEEQV